MHTTPEVTAAILAGGKSTRMGTDKGVLPVHGRPMIELVRAAVASLCRETILVTNTPAQYAHLQLPMFGDEFPEHGSLGGLYTAVQAARWPHVLVVACDMPLLNPALLAYLIAARHAADAIVPQWGEFPEPLHAVYSKSCASAMLASLQAKRLKITSFFGACAVRIVQRAEIEVFDPAGVSFNNVNTPDELAAVISAPANR